MTIDVHLPWPATARQLRLDDLYVDLRFRRVDRDGECIELPQRMFELLLLFIAEPGVVHDRGDLFRRIWPGVIVEDGNLSQSVWMLRKALGESRRHWLRTVAKRGYVFEPPSAVEPVMPAMRAPATSATATEGPDTTLAVKASASQAKEAPAMLRRNAGWLAVAALVLMVGVMTVLQGRDARQPFSPRAISLIVLSDPADQSASLPVALLDAWLGWRLGMSPDVLLLSPAHLAADSDKQDTTQLVTLSSGPVAGDTGRLYLQAAIQGDETVRVEGETADVAMLVDTLAKNVYETLLPLHVGKPWPTLKVTPELAERYLAMRRARDGKQWAQAAALGEKLVHDAPTFGLARYELAQVQSVLGRVQPAQANLQGARDLLAPLPKEVEWLFDAQLLALGSDHDAVVDAYSDLTREYPHQPRFALELARARIRAGHYAEALQILSPDVWSRQPASVRISQLLIRGDAEQAMGDGAAARVSALHADQIAERAGWIYERGWATLLLAQSHSLEQRSDADMSLFNTAADYFEQAGDELHALRARLLATSFTAHGAPVDEEQLDILMARAQEIGHPRMAMHALRAVAYRHYRDGRLAAYRQRLEQAEDLARAADDQHALALFDVDRVNEDIMVGDLRAASRRLDRVRRAGGMQGDAGHWLGYFGAYLAWREGRFDDAVAALADLTDGSPLAAVPADLKHCLLAAVANVRGDPDKARQAYTRCRTSQVPVVSLAAELGLARVDLDEGDAGRARARATATLDRLSELDSVPDRWLIELEAAAVLLRAGDRQRAGALYQQLAASLAASGYRLMEADAVIGRAETALTEGDWIAVEQHIAHVERLLLSRDWQLESRLSVLRVVHAQAVGEHNAAAGHLHRLDRQAHRIGDIPVRTLAHDLYRALALEQACDARIHASEPRVASDWLLAALPTQLVDAGPGG